MQSQLWRIQKPFARQRSPTLAFKLTLMHAQELRNVIKVMMRALMPELRTANNCLITKIVRASIKIKSKVKSLTITQSKGF